jgi:hypothetical protein
MPQRFSPEVDVYGLSGGLLDSMRHDTDLCHAIETLISSSARSVSLGGGKVQVAFAKRVPQADRDGVKDALVTVAQRLEELSGGFANHEASVAKVCLPFAIFTCVALGTWLAAVAASGAAYLVNAFDLLPSFVTAALAVLGIEAILGSLTLRKHAVATVALPILLSCASFGAVFLAMAISLGLNFSLGRELFPDVDEVVTGHVVQMSRKGHPCYLVFNQPPVLDVFGSPRGSVLVSCAFLRKGRTRDEVRQCKLRLNPGYLKAPFIDELTCRPDTVEDSTPRSLSSEG